MLSVAITEPVQPGLPFIVIVGVVVAIVVVAAIIVVVVVVCIRRRRRRLVKTCSNISRVIAVILC